MMNTNKTRISAFDLSKRLATAVITTAVVVAPLVANQQTAQADPPSHAKAHGYQKNKNKNKKDKEWKRDRRDRNRDRDQDDDRDDDDRYDNDDRDNDRNDYRDSRTLTGVVTRDLDGDRFEVRTANGRNVVVELRGEREPRELTVGDRVRVDGSFVGRSLIFRATNVDIVRDRNDSDNGWWNRDPNRDRDRNNEGWSGDDSRFNQAVNFPGTVVTTPGSARIVVRADNGRQYVVVGRNAFDSRISAGDRVRVVGRSRDATVLADRVELTENRR